VRLAVDDAGAGFSSLHHILLLSPDIIKLDITLVRDINRDPVKRALAWSLVTFAREIGSTIIAEGIETAAELATLVELGIPWGQGYHLGRPEPLPVVDLGI
jgi:EAL domain-containing protein (putative c-di-GMP-specific phosphodiesterase class I)